MQSLRLKNRVVNNLIFSNCTKLQDQREDEMTAKKGYSEKFRIFFSVIIN